MVTNNSVIQHAQLTAYITPASVGAVIGRKGARILQIQKDAGKQVRISVMSSSPSPTSDRNVPTLTCEDDQDDIPESVKNDIDHNQESDFHDTEQWIPVIIRGDSSGIIKAAKLVLNALEDPSDMDDVVLEVPIHRTKHSAIIGKKGMNIMKLSADHDVRIMVPPPSKDTVEKGSQNIVQLEGKLFAVEDCLADMIQILSSPPTAVGAKSTPQLPPEIPGVRVFFSKNHIKLIISPELESLVPSLTQLRAIGRLTNGLIRRKRVKNLKYEKPVSEDESDSEESDRTAEDDAIPSTSPVATELLITSQSKKPQDESIRMKCFLELHRVLQVGSLNDGDIDQVKGDGNDEIASSIKQRPYRKRRVGGRGSKGSIENA